MAGSMLVHLKTIDCPKCGCISVEEESVDTSNGKIRMHTNGQRWEYRTFTCGYKAEFSPNYGRDIEADYSRCRNDEEYIEKMKKREAAIDTLILTAQQVEGIDDNFKADLVYRVKTMKHIL
jgi:predicted nucleic-acid-binding Zn-ribbon protein